MISNASMLAPGPSRYLWWPSSPPLASLDLSPSPASAWKPFYYHPHESMLSWIPDKHLALVGPIAVYWLVSLWFQTLDTLRLPFFEKYRLHEPEEIQKKNKASASKVVVMVLVQQIVQTMLGAFVLEDEETVRRQVFQDHGENMRKLGVYLAHVVCGTVGYSSGLRLLNRFGLEAVQWLYWWGIPVAQFWFAFLVMDTWQYVFHRAFHESRFLYRHFHSHHHRLYVPYSFGALYNHPLEGLLFDSASGAVSHALSLMTVRQAILLFTFSTLKTVCDHGGYAFPWWLDPLHLVFPNCAEYHDVHHQMQGLRYNYSQPFFIHFDVLFGTRISSEKFEKMRQANKKGRDRERAERLAMSSGNASAKDEVPTASSAAATSAETVPRKRVVQGGRTDISPEDIALSEKDPFTTTDIDSYRAKAGTTT
ncbi:unnamed protein product [Parajaminaea phylloscopi]